MPRHIKPGHALFQGIQGPAAGTDCTKTGILYLARRPIIYPVQRLESLLRILLLPPDCGSCPSSLPRLNEGVFLIRLPLIENISPTQTTVLRELHSSKTAASSLLAAGKFDDDRRCPYVSTVVVIVECPSMACTYLTDSLFANSSEA